MLHMSPDAYIPTGLWYRIATAALEGANESTIYM